MAHGTSATMDTYSGTVEWPDGTGIPSDDARSSLLHSSNRGVCARCHVDGDGQVFMHGNGDGGGSGGAGCGSAGCHDSGSHSTHLMENPKGPSPVPDCLECHADGQYPDFEQGKDLNATTICDNCHSPDGDYDGVNDLTIGAKANWYEGVYYEDVYAVPTLKLGKEKWCAGCHDGDPLDPLALPANNKSDGTGIYAPSVIGDEYKNIGYGIGYGFYKTGHGVSSTEAYPASERGGAGLECLDCHDADIEHIDGVARSYEPASEYTLIDPPSAHYKTGYRLSSVEVDVTPFGYPSYNDPLHVPRTGNGSGGGKPPGFREEWEFALCFQSACHDNDSLFNGGNPFTGENAGTYFHAVANRENEGLPGIGGNPKPDEGYWYSMHDVHTWGINGPGDPDVGLYTGQDYPQYDSDYDGIADSRMTCPACHNVHGSSSPAMVRDGALVGKTGFGFQYTHPTDPYPTLANSTGGMTPPIGSGQGTVADNGICNMCHPNATSYSRPNHDATGPVISGLSPVRDAIGVGIDSDVEFTLTDSDGVNWSSLSVKLSGDKGYLGTYSHNDSEVSEASGTVTVDPNTDFGTGEIITITVEAADTPGNPILPRTVWSFITTGESFVVLHPSGLASDPRDPSGYTFRTVGGPWSTILDSNDGDGSWAWKWGPPPTDTFWVNMDDPNALLGGKTITGITLYAYARYMSSAKPDAIPYTGNINIGYKTGTATVWKGNTSLDDSGNYNLVISSSYSLDSDGGELDLDDINALQFAVARSSYGPRQLRITEVYVKIHYTP